MCPDGQAECVRAMSSLDCPKAHEDTEAVFVCFMHSLGAQLQLRFPATHFD